MGLKLKSPLGSDEIHPMDMGRGDVGVLVASDCHGDGRLVMRTKTALIDLTDGTEWTSAAAMAPHYRVRSLPSNTPVETN